MTVDLIGADMPRWVGMLASTRQYAEVLANTDFVPKAFRGQPDAVTAAIMYGDELGVSPQMALQSIDVVEGKPRPSATLARALVLAAGHDFKVHEMTGNRCRVSGLRAGRPEQDRLVVEWTIDMAKAAGLAGRSNWKSYPRAMLAARATSDLVNLVFPDVMKGLTWVSEEASRADQVEGWAPAGDVDTATPTRKPRKAVQRAPRPTRALPSPGYAHATEDNPGPDGSWDEPIPETVPPKPDPDPEPEPEPWNAPPAPAAELEAPPVELPAEVPDPDSEPEAPPKPISRGQQKILQTLLGLCLGSSASPEERHQVIGLAVRRQVDSATTLTAAEATTAIDMLTQVDKGQLRLDLTANGWAVVIPDEPPPPPTQYAFTPIPEPTEDPWGDLGGKS